MVADGIYKEITYKPKSAKSTRLICHKEAITFERVLKPNLVTNLLQTLKSNKYKISIRADKAIYMPSVMFEYVDVNKISKDIRKNIQEYKLKNIIAKKSDDVLLNILVYENDKLDPGKKTQKSKLYAGYIEISAKVGKVYVYKVQIDFMNLKGKDIPKRVSCLTKSIMTLNTIKSK
jgi:hypothetical protein